MCAKRCLLCIRGLVNFSPIKCLIFVDILAAIPTLPNGGNHTIGFTKAAASQEAHDATLLVSKGLAHTGFRALRDDDFFKQVRNISLKFQPN